MSNEDFIILLQRWENMLCENGVKIKTVVRKEIKQTIENIKKIDYVKK